MVKCSLESFMFSTEPARSSKDEYSFDIIRELPLQNKNGLPADKSENKRCQKTSRDAWQYQPADRDSLSKIFSQKAHREDRSDRTTIVYAPRSVYKKQARVKENISEEEKSRIQSLNRSFDSQIESKMWTFKPTARDLNLVMSQHSSRSPSRSRNLSCYYQPDALDDFYSETLPLESNQILIEGDMLDTNKMAAKNLNDYKLYKSSLSAANNACQHSRDNLLNKALETKSFLTEEESKYLTGKGEVSSAIKEAKIKLARCREFNLPVPRGLLRPQQPPYQIGLDDHSSRRRGDATKTHTKLGHLDDLMKRIYENKMRRSYLLHRVIEETRFDHENPLWKNAKRNKGDSDFELFKLLQHKLNLH